MTTPDSRLSTVMHVAPTAGDMVRVLGDVATFKVPAATSGGSLIIAEIVTQPGGGPPGLHAHPTEEAFYVLEGEFDASGVSVDGEPYTVRACAGSVIYVPSGAAHNFRNAGTAPGRLLAIYTSPELEAMARELAALPADVPPTQAMVAEILGRHGIRFLGASNG